jgi:4-alpha-glucanotransferase
MDEMRALRSLAKAMGVHTRYTDGLGKRITVAPKTLVRVCAALGAPVERPAEAAEALRAHRAAARAWRLPPVLVAWDGILAPVTVPRRGRIEAQLTLTDGTVVPLARQAGELRAPAPVPLGYHRLAVAAAGARATCTVIAAPVAAYRRPGDHRSWGVGTQLAALRTRRSRAVADLADLESLCRWVRDKGGDLVTALPLSPTFNTPPPEPSPYSPVSRLFWSELIADLGEAHRPCGAPATLDVTRADGEVRAALAGWPRPDPSAVDAELARYARYRGAQVRLGRNWRDWPAAARAGTLQPDQVDAEEERFHLVAQTLVWQQLRDLRARLDRDGFRLGLDLAVGVHPDGYDPWSRQTLFGDGMSVGAPPDRGFPSGQDWGFSPVLPAASRREGHAYVAASIAHQAGLAGVLRVDHMMAWTRLYWIPHGFGLHEGTYVSYPAEELFAVLTLESHRHRCEVVGENLGTVPPEIDDALPRHRIWGMYVAQFQAADDPKLAPPTAASVALLNTHDTPTFAGWLGATDVGERVHHGLLAKRAAPRVRRDRAAAAERLARHLGRSVDQPLALLDELLDWLGRSESPLVVPWLEDFWLEDIGVNLPGTRSSERPNWQRPMRLLLDEVLTDPDIERLVRRLNRARRVSVTAGSTTVRNTEGGQ